MMILLNITSDGVMAVVVFPRSDLFDKNKNTTLFF